MEDDERGRQPSFKVQDRRRFAATGEARSDVPEEDAAESPAERSSPSTAGDAPHLHGAHEGHDHEGHAHEGHEHGAGDQHAHGGEEITFASFIFSLSTQALVHLGEIPDPADGATHANLEAARQIIDILAILHEKTANNLDAAEGALLENALYDLRMRFVERARQRS